MIPDTEDEIYWRQMYLQCKDAENNSIDDNHYYQVALNLSGKREELEERAVKLIDKVGYIKALKQSRTKQ